MFELDDVNVYYGESTTALARIYVDMPTPRRSGSWHLSGWVRGPYCSVARTLPATYALEDLAGPADAQLPERLLACAQVPDPCFWSARLPALYEVHVELRDGDHEAGATRRRLGIRHLGVIGRSLVLEGRRWVVRGVGRSAVNEPLLTRWSDLAAAMLVESPDEELCKRASEHGVLLVVRMGSPENLADQLRKLARWAAVAIVVLDRETANRDDLSSLAPNVLLAEHIPADRPFVSQPWAQIVAREVDTPSTFARELQDCRLPILAIRQGPGFEDLQQARAGCDRLQRDLAAYVDVAGYLVT